MVTHIGSTLQVLSLGSLPVVLYGCSLRVFSTGVLYGCSLRVFSSAFCSGILLGTTVLILLSTYMGPVACQVDHHQAIHSILCCAYNHSYSCDFNTAYSRNYT